MKLLLVALGLAAVATARMPSQSWERETYPEPSFEEDAFRTGKEFQFRYKGQVATGIPGASKEHAATQIEALVSLLLKGESKALLKIHKVRMGRLQQKLFEPRAMLPFMAMEEVEMQPEMLKQIQLPVMFTYTQGYVSDVVFDGEEHPWSANMKKGIMNLLQVNLGKRNQIKVAEEAAFLNRMPEAQLDPALDFYATQEKTVEGECETLYTITSDPVSPRLNGDVLNVTRSIDFENCKQRPEIKYNFRFQDPCESCQAKYAEDEKFLKSSSVAKFNITGTREAFLIQSAIVESQYQLVPFTRQGNLISTYINQTLVLIRAGAITSKDLRAPKNPQQSESDLMYTMDWDVEMEEFLMKGGQRARLPVDIKGRVEMIKRVLEQLMEQVTDCVDNDAPLVYARLVKMFRLADKTQLEEIFQTFVFSRHQAFSQQQHLKITAFLTDALADAATKDSISLLLHLIKEQKIQPLRAALTIKHLINIPTPSKEIVREFLSFLESPVVEENFVLKQAAYLTLGSIVQALCMPSEERLASLPRPSFDKLPRRLGPNSHLCPNQLQEHVLQKLFEMVKEAKESSESLEDAMLGLKSIGNTGIPKAVLELEKIIRSEASEYPKIIRIEAIKALRQLRELLPQKIQQILVPIFMAKYESNDVRIAAVYQLLQTQPSRPVLDQLARKLFTERSHQVASFVYTYMQTLANSSNPCELRFAKDLQLSLRHGRKISGAFLPQYSKVIHVSAHSKAFRVGMDAQFVSVISNSTFVPRFLSIDLHANALGFWSKYIASISIAQEGVETLFSRFIRRTEFDDISLDDILSRSPRSQQSPVKELKKIWEKLSTVPRQFQGVPKAFASLRLKDQEFFMAPITQKSLRSIPSVQHIRRLLQEGSHFHIFKAAQLHEFLYKIPSSIGMPIIVKVAIPTLAQLSGQIRVDMKNPFKLHLNQVKPSVAVSVLTSVTAWSPVASSGVKVVATAKLCTPISGKVQVDMKARMPSIRFSLQPMEKPLELLRMETHPMTFTRLFNFPITTYPKAQYKTIVGEQWDRVMNIRDYPVVHKAEKMIKKIFGQEVRVASLWHRTPMNAPAYVPVCPFSGPNHFAIHAKPAQDTPKEYVLKISAKNIKKMSEKLSSSSFQPFEDSEETYESENIQTEGFETVVKAEVYTKGAQQEKKAQMETKLKFSPSLQMVKMESVMETTAVEGVIPSPVKSCVSGFVQYPGPAQTYSQLSGKAVVAELKTTWGNQECKEENKVEVKMGAKHSNFQRELMEEEPEFRYFSQRENCEEEPQRCSPVNLEDFLQRPQQLLQYYAQAKYSNVAPVVKNITQGLFRALKTYYYWNTNQMNFNLRNPEGLIRAQFTVDPKTRQFFNLTVKTPVENVTFTDAELPLPVFTPVSIRRLPSLIDSPADILENFVSPILPKCSINSRRIATFDDVEFRAPLSTCFSLLAKDCDSETNPAYAVLIKKLSAESSQKVLKIVTRKYTIVMLPESSSYDSLKVKVNGKVLAKEELPSDSEIRFEEIGEALKVILPSAGVRVAFDGYAAKVEVSPLAASAQCGLCGHYDGELQDEFRTPDFQLTSDVRRFIQSYTLKEGSCDFPTELNDVSEEDTRLQYQPEWEQEERYTDVEQEDEDEEMKEDEEFSFQPRRSFRPVRRFVVEEESGKLCVSEEKIPRCPRDSFPAKYEKSERTLSFKCISRRHDLAHHILRSIHKSGPLPDFVAEEISQLPQSYTNEYPVPKLCKRHF